MATDENKTVVPISPNEILDARKLDENLLVTNINNRLKENLSADGTCKIYLTSLKQQLGPKVTDTNVDNVIEKFRMFGWQVQKEVGVQVDKNECDTVYTFKAVAR